MGNAAWLNFPNLNSMQKGETSSDRAEHFTKKPLLKWLAHSQK
jgi:hypothetical protein